MSKVSLDWFSMLAARCLIKESWLGFRGGCKSRFTRQVETWIDRVIQDLSRQGLLLDRVTMSSITLIISLCLLKAHVLLLHLNTNNTYLKFLTINAI